MKVFEVVCEYLKGDEVIQSREFVTHEADSITSVTAYYGKHCSDYDKELKSVSEVLTIVQHIDT
jgi:hypothetical protein